MYSNILVSDETLIKQFSQGSNDALQQIFTLYYKPLVFFANKIINDLPQAEDITAESFYALYIHRLNFDSLAKIKAYLFMANRNACLNWIKARRRHQLSHNEIKYLSQASASTEDSQTEQLALAQLPALIHALPPQCAQVCSMLFFKGMKTGEIAQVMGISNQTVLNHKQRAIHIIRQALKKKQLLSLGALLLPLAF